jgi:hypothetical protein
MADYINKSYASENTAYAANLAYIPVVVSGVGAIGYIQKVSTGYIPTTSDKQQLSRDGKPSKDTIFNIVPAEVAILAVERYASAN